MRHYKLACKRDLPITIMCMVSLACRLYRYGPCTMHCAAVVRRICADAFCELGLYAPVDCDWDYSSTANDRVKTAIIWQRQSDRIFTLKERVHFTHLISSHLTWTELNRICSLSSLHFSSYEMGWDDWCERYFDYTWSKKIFTDRVSTGNNAIASVRTSVTQNPPPTANPNPNPNPNPTRSVWSWSSFEDNFLMLHVCGLAE